MTHSFPTRRSSDLVSPFLELTKQGKKLVLDPKPPIPSPQTDEITLFDPSLSLVGMATARPAPQCFPDLMIALVEGAGRHLRAVVVRPTPNDRSKAVYDFILPDGTHFPKDAADLEIGRAHV